MTSYYVVDSNGIITQSSRNNGYPTSLKFAIEAEGLFLIESDLIVPISDYTYDFVSKQFKAIPAVEEA